jgi:hypothetical protein
MSYTNYPLAPGLFWDTSLFDLPEDADLYTAQQDAPQVYDPAWSQTGVSSHDPYDPSWGNTWSHRQHSSGVTPADILPLLLGGR